MGNGDRLRLFGRLFIHFINNCNGYFAGLCRLFLGCFSRRLLCQLGIQLCLAFRGKVMLVLNLRITGRMNHIHKMTRPLRIKLDRFGCIISSLLSSLDYFNVVVNGLTSGHPSHSPCVRTPRTASALGGFTLVCSALVRNTAHSVALLLIVSRLHQF